jgi:iron complex outermembrane receptor protein
MKATVALVLVCASVGLSVAQQSDAAIRRYDLDIPRQALDTALKELAKQTGLQVARFSDRGNGSLMVGPVRGEVTAETALDSLLEASGLTYRVVNDRTIAVMEPDTLAPSAWVSSTKGEGGSHAENERTAPGQGRAAQASEVKTQTDAETEPQGAEARDNLPIEEIVVTGSRLRGRDVVAAPVTVFNRTKIDELGASTVADVLKYLPQQPYNRSQDFRQDGGQFVEMRGLGVDTTLVLINGRRAVPSAPNVSSNAFDLNAIPLAAIERIEVLSDSASAVYGADAMGGVLNIILKQDIPTPILDLHVGTAEGGAEERRVSFSAGHTNDRLRASFVLDHFSREFLLGQERDRHRDQDFRRFGSIDQRSLDANPGNITSRTPDNLPGLPSRVAAVPQGSSGVLTPDDFLATAGQQHKESLARFSSTIPEADRRSAAVFGEFDLTPATTAFAELLIMDRTSINQLSPSAISGGVVPASNPFNPFGTDVSVNYLFDEIGVRRQVWEAELQRATAGLRGALGSWDWELAVLRSEEDAATWRENEVDAVRVGGALSSTDPDQALNVFQDGPAGNPALLASLIDDPVISAFSAEGTQASGFLRGAPFRLPAGEAELALGGEWREEGIVYDRLPFFISRDRQVVAGFAELRLPLVNAEWHLPALRSLTLTVAGRHDHYSDFGDTFNPQYGLAWSPASDFVVRVSHGTSFRPPSLFELYTPRITVPLVVTDVRRNNEVYGTTVVTGGNPDLDPIEADSTTVGIVFTPRTLPGLRVSASYWQIEMQRKIALLPVLQVVANEADFPGRVVRAEPSPADAAAGRSGVIQTVDISRMNGGTLDTSGVDLSASYLLETAIGSFAPTLSATWVEQFTAVDIPGTPPVERVGVAHIQGTIPRWRAVASLAWSRRGLGLSATAYYVSSYEDASVLAGLTGRTVPAQTLVDAQGSIDFDEFLGGDTSWLGGVLLTVGVSNLFDEEPNFSTIGGSIGYDTSQGDLKQRFGYLRLSKHF